MTFIRANYPLSEILDFRESGYTDKILVELINELGQNTDWDIYIYFELSRWKGKDLEIQSSPRRKMVICVGDESVRIAYSFLADVDIVFRMYLSTNQVGKIYHLPVGPSKHFLPAEPVLYLERPYNVFFFGNLHQGRAGLYRALTGLPAIPFSLLHRLRWLFGEKFDSIFPDSIIRFSTGFHNGIPTNEYAKYLAESKIVLCPAGIENPESMRHFEAASSGCVVITERMPDVAVYRNAPFVVLSSWKELKPTVRRLLREPARLEDIHAQTVEWWHQTAKPEAVAQLMVRHLNTASSTKFGSNC